MGDCVRACHRLDDKRHRDVADECQHCDENEADQPARLGERRRQRQRARPDNQVEQKHEPDLRKRTRVYRTVCGTNKGKYYLPMTSSCRRWFRPHFSRPDNAAFSPISYQQQKIQ